MRARSDSIKAEDAAKLATPNLPGGRKGLWNGPADAYRHCLWSCLMTTHIGAKQAKKVGDIHENWGDKRTPPQTPEERQMDEANNAAGRQCGNSDNPKSCEKNCLQKLMNNQLFGLGGKPLIVAP